MNPIDDVIRLGSSGMFTDYRFLRPNSFPAVYRTFVSAFADYAVDMSNVRILNIDHRDHGMLAFLERIGFRVYVSQYEMELIL